MTADTWAALVAHHYQLPPSVTYDEKQLTRAVNLDRRLTSFLDSTGEATEHTNVFRKWFKPKGSKSNIYCYYATAKGKKPNSESNEKWFTKITNANILVFSSGITTPPQDNVNNKAQKWKRPQNQGNGEPGIQNATILIRFERLRGMHIIIISLGYNIKLGL